MKLAVFSGQYFWFNGKNYSTNEAFAKFVTSFSSYFENIVFCDALVSENKTQPYVLDPSTTSLCALPHFSLYSLWKDILLNFIKIYTILRRNIHDWDVVWLHAPHPVSLIFIYVCRKFNKPFFFFIRQNLAVYVGCRNPGKLQPIAVLTAKSLEAIFRKLSKHTLTFTVGKEMYDEYKKSTKMVFQTSVSLVSREDIARSANKPSRNMSAPFKLLSIGRLDREKGVIYLIQALYEVIVERGRHVSLEIVGTGTEDNMLKFEVKRLGIASHVHFLGYLDHGEKLFAKYRDCDAYVLPSLTEGWPQTILEAMACKVPVIATRVGGIPHAIKDGVNGLLVSPASPGQIRMAIEKLIDDNALRNQLIANGLETVKEHTMEAERDRIFSCIQQNLLMDV